MRKNWTIEEEEILKAVYATTSTKEVAEQLGRQPSKVYHKAFSMGLKKTPEFLLATNRALLARVQNKETRFKKGNVPATKGKKQTEFMTVEAIERTKATRFQKGMKPHNHVEVGHQTLTKGGYIVVKVAEPNRFELLHRWIWKIWNGPIPKGCVIAFIDGNKQNCAIENMKLITHAENMANNTIQRYPEEVKDLIRLQTKLNKAIKSIV